MKKDMDEIIEKYTKMIYRIAYIYLKNVGDAEDIVQEVFIKYFMNDKEFIDEEHEKNWIIRVTVNLCKNVSVSGWRKHVVPLESKYLELQTEEQHRMLEHLERLNKKYRIVVQLFYYEDLSIERISKILGITESNVKTRLNRARKVLKEDIEKGEILYGKI